MTYPDVMIVLILKSRLALGAKSRRGEDRFESKGHAYHEKVRAVF